MQINIVSATKKNVPIYNLTITVTEGGSSKTIKLAESFTQWFDEQGRFVAVPFQQILATAVPLIGKRDPKRVAVSQDLLDASPDVLDAILAADTAAGSSTATDAQKGGKRRKA